MFQDQPQLSIREAASTLDISTAIIHVPKQTTKFPSSSEQWQD